MTSATAHGLLVNAASDVTRADKHPSLDNVAHIFDVEWHGIRSATACLPGHKLGISHRNHPDGDALHFLFNYIEVNGISNVCFQAASDVALSVASILKTEYDSRLSLSAVTHVSAAQFINHFEMEMLGKLLLAQKAGVFDRLGSVKPGLNELLPEFWPGVLINSPPTVDPVYAFRDMHRALCPVENNWRKNLYGNVIAALRSPEISQVLVVNEPTGLSNLIDTQRVAVIPFLPPLEMLSVMSGCALILHASLVECQPMTELEGLSVGTPSITTSWGIHPQIDDHELSKLTSIPSADDVGAIKRSISRIVDLWSRDPQSMLDLTADMSQLRLTLSRDSYTDFLAWTGAGA